MCIFLSVMAYGQSPFEKGVQEFKDENYEEALGNFIEARKADPGSSSAAFYLGLTYKIMEEYKNATPHLRDAVTLTPSVKEALIELVDVLYQTNEVAEAKKWIEVGEKEGIQPARLQFLKGLVLVKEEKYGEAIPAFEKAKALDPSLSQAAEFQIANAYMRQGKLKAAGERFRIANTINPNTDTATYARDYEKMVAEKLEKERPFRFAIGLAYKHDSNVVIKGSGPISDAISGQADSALNLSLRAGYTAPFSFRTPYNFSLQYSLYAERYFSKSYTRADGTRGNLSEYNVMTNVISAVPGYNFSRFSLSIPVGLGYTSLQGQKSNDFTGDINWFSDTRYMRYANVNPTLRIMLSQSMLGEAYFGYMDKRYYHSELHPAPIDPAEDRDGKVMSASLAWMYFFKEGKGVISLRYTYADDKTDGDNWANRENRFGVSFLCPIKGALKAQVTGDAAFVDYKYTHTVFDAKRRDEIYTGTLGLIYELFKNTDIIAQYTYIRDKSNIEIYDYKREVFMLGFEYRY
jgi:tetratricopeptide (TPR) repeat protein